MIKNNDIAGVLRALLATFDSVAGHYVFDALAAIAEPRDGGIQLDELSSEATVLVDATISALAETVERDADALAAGTFGQGGVTSEVIAITADRLDPMGSIATAILTCAPAVDPGECAWCGQESDRTWVGKTRHGAYRWDGGDTIIGHVDYQEQEEIRLCEACWREDTEGM
jgi:hypothetical protein